MQNSIPEGWRSVIEISMSQEITQWNATGKLPICHFYILYFNGFSISCMKWMWNYILMMIWI